MSMSAGRRIEIGVLTTLVLGMLLLGVVQRFPFIDDVNTNDSSGDDWLNYKVNAISILDEGLGMASVPGPYYTPGAFLYNYFVAGVFAIFGRNTAFVYILQYAFLGLSVVLMYFFARRGLSPPLAWLFFVLGALFQYEAFRWWVMRLLSENLVIVLYPPALILAAAAIRRDSVPLAAWAGLFAGVLVLMRQNMLLFPAAIAVCVFLFQRDRRGLGKAAVLGIVAALVIGIQPLRNIYVSGQWFASGYETLLPSGTIGEITWVFARRALFCIGVLVGGWDDAGSDIVVAKRWLLMNVGAMLSVAMLLWRRRFTIEDGLSVATLIAAFAPFIFMSKLGGYGFRFQTPYGLLVMLLFMRGVQVLVDDRSRGRKEAFAPAVS